jgi:peptidoglycan hydrolase-like protein with peptidoglycan-binding domain
MRRGLILLTLVAGVAGAAACSDDDEPATTDTEAPVPTPFQTIATTTTAAPPTTLDPNAPTTPPPTDAAGGVVTSVAGGTLPPPGVCVPGTYTIQATDTTRTRVAEKFDVTVEALDAANANTAGYGAFFPGLDIIIPC